MPEQVNGNKLNYGRVAVGLLCFGLVLRLLGLNKGIWLDEYSSLELITRPNFLQALRLYDHPPLYFILLKLWSHLNSSEPFLRLLSLIFGLATMAVVMKWLKYYTDTASLLAGLGCATMPIMLAYSQEIRNYALLLLGTALSFYFASRLRAESKKLTSYLGLTLSLTMTVSTHLVGLMVIPSVYFFMAISWVVDKKSGFGVPSTACTGSISVSKSVAKQNFVVQPTKAPVGQQSFALDSVALAVPMMTFLFLYFVFLPPTLHQRSGANWWMPSASLPQILVTVKYILGVPTILGTSSIRSALDSPQGIIGVVLGIISIVPLAFGNWRRSLPFLATAGLYWLELWLASALIAPMFIPRTALPALIPLLGFVSVQIATIRVQKLKLLSLFGLILLSLTFTLNWVTKEAWLPVEEWSKISQALQTNWKQHDLVIFYPGYNEGITRYYLTRDLPTESVVTIWIGGTREKLGQSREQIQLIESRNFSSALFLVFRDDQNVAMEIEVAHELLTMLESKFGKPLELQHVGNISISKYAR